MKLPNPHKAILGDKLERYSLNLQHSIGRHKVFVFQRRLGITLTNKQILEKALIEATETEEAIVYKQDAFGVHYNVTHLPHFIL